MLKIEERAIGICENASNGKKMNKMNNAVTSTSKVASQTIASNGNTCSPFLRLTEQQKSTMAQCDLKHLFFYRLFFNW